MPWLRLSDELQEITCDPKWDAAKDIAHLQDALFQEIGATAVDDLEERLSEASKNIPGAAMPGALQMRRTKRDAAACKACLPTAS